MLRREDLSGVVPVAVISGIVTVGVNEKNISTAMKESVPRVADVIPDAATQ